MGVSDTLPETLTLFQTKICDFSHPISDLTGTYTIGVNIKREIVLLLNDEEVASSKKNIPNSRLECTNHTLFQTKMVKIDTLFQTKTAKKPYHLAPHIPYQPVSVREYPPPGCQVSFVIFALTF